jgi:hypothetical protein
MQEKKKKMKQKLLKMKRRLFLIVLAITQKRKGIEKLIVNIKGLVENMILQKISLTK